MERNRPLKLIDIHPGDNLLYKGYEPCMVRALDMDTDQVTAETKSGTIVSDFASAYISMRITSQRLRDLGLKRIETHQMSNVHPDVDQIYGTFDPSHINTIPGAKRWMVMPKESTNMDPAMTNCDWIVCNPNVSLAYAVRTVAAIQGTLRSVLSLQYSIRYGKG